MELERVDVSTFDEAATSALVDRLDRDGAVIAENLLSDDLLTRFNADLDPLLEQAPDGGGETMDEFQRWFFGPKTRNVTGMAGRSRVFATEILTHPVFRAASDAILLPNCGSYHLNLAHVLDRGPGSEPQMLHYDQLVWPHLPADHPQVELASVIALNDFSADNGATVIAPGSHRWDRDRRPKGHELAAAEMKAGSAVIYLGTTIHAGGANTTDDRRRGMHLSYCLGWLRTEENQYLATPLDVARTLPLESLALLGYAKHDGMGAGGGPLGAVDQQDPAQMLVNGTM